MTQKEALDILKTGRNVFLTGAAGSGKTFVLRQYIDYLKKLGARVGITASTGIAATHMSGTTIHSWSGIGIKDKLSKSDLQEIAEKRHVRKQVEKASILIIDEVSMMHHYLLDLADKVIREVKKSSDPFGGMQVIFCGDFFQLPPVRKASDPESFFAYHSDSWKNLNLKVCYLSEQHRQNDLEYLKILNAVRNSCISDEIINILQDRIRSTSSAGQVTKLYSHNRNVDNDNESELAKLPGKIYEYKMRSRGNHNLVETLKKSCLAPEVLRLKAGAKVMFVKNNFEEGYVNGTLGIVVKCGHNEIRVQTNSGQIIEVEPTSWLIEEEGKIKAEINQYPLRLAWAITIHKSQGMSLDEAEIDLTRSFERGMGYVALSRIRSLDGLFLKGFNEMALRVNEEVLEVDKKFRDLSKTNCFHIKTMGERKLKDMHDDFAKKIYRSAKASADKEKPDTVEETRNLLDEGLSIKEVAKKRNLKAETIISHIEKIKEKEPSYNIFNLRNSVPKNKFNQIYSAFRKVGINEGKYHLAPVKNLLGPKYSYDDLRLVRLFL